MTTTKTFSFTKLSSDFWVKKTPKNKQLHTTQLVTRTLG